MRVLNCQQAIILFILNFLEKLSLELDVDAFSEETLHLQVLGTLSLEINKQEF